jgi:hypothetical protein
MRKRKPKVPVNFRAEEIFRRRLNIASEILDVPYTKLIVDSTNENLDRLAKRNPDLKEALESVAA